MTVKSERADNSRKRRRSAREAAREAKRQKKQPPEQPPQPPQPEQQQEQQAQPKPQEEKRLSDERAVLRVDIAREKSASTQQQTAGVTLGLNSVTRALETCQPSADNSNSSPFALLILTSCFPPAITAHFTYYSHYLHTPLLTLHPSITTQQLAHCLSPSLTSLLVLALHNQHLPSLLAALLPMARVQHIGWLAGQGGGYASMRIDRVERSEERSAKEEVKRKAREAAQRATRPLSPKSVAAAVFKQKQAAAKAALEAAAPTAPQLSADVALTAVAGSTADSATSLSPSPQIESV